MKVARFFIYNMSTHQIQIWDRQEQRAVACAYTIADARRIEEALNRL